MLLLFFITLCAASVLESPNLNDLLRAGQDTWMSLANPREIYPDAYLTTIQLIEKHGYQGETHVVTTRDKYILELHRIPGRRNETITKKPVIFLMHGLLANSASWVITGPNNALVYLLVDAGYDVWMGNARGSTYSRKHVTLTTKDEEYWQFSWHEIAVEDVPASIDYVLKQTGQKKLIYLGHSQGTTIFFAMASVLPEYQNKIKAMFAFAPVVYSSRMPNLILQFMAKYVHIFQLIANLIKQFQVEPTNDLVRNFTGRFCAVHSLTQPICLKLFVLGGHSANQLNKTLVPVIMGHVPAGASIKQFMHYGQLLKSGRFAQFDHGFVSNLRKYNSFLPPLYDLKSIKVPVYLHYSMNDWFVHVKDINQLYNELGCPALKLQVPDREFNHMDFLWAIDAKRLLYDKVLILMSRLDDN